MERIHVPASSHHRRPLPEGLVPLSGTYGRRRFMEAMRSGHMEMYFPLSEQFVTQSEPAFCGLGSLTMVMNAMQIDPLRIWKDAPTPGWRWWTDEMFLTHCSGSLEEVRAAGMTMDDFELLALANGAVISMHRPTDVTESIESFRSNIVHAMRGDGKVHIVVSFSRSALKQTGDGHFSPIGGYHPESDSVLVLDVARFKYPPYWVPVRSLWTACSAIDPVTKRSRGWFQLARAASQRLPSAVPTALDMGKRS